MAITISGDGISSDAIASLAASKLTGQVPDANAPSGSVLQVVQGSYATTTVSSSSNTFADTGLSVSITPSSASSKILVVVNQGGCGKQTNNTGLNYRLVRNSTVIQDILNAGFYNSTTTQARFNVVSAMYLDSPATTSSVTYKTQLASYNNNDVVQVNDTGGDPIKSTITVMEIAG